MNVVGYARVSTQEQASEGVSLADQERRVRAFIADRGWELEGFHADKGVSGSVPFADRPAGAEAYYSGLPIVVTAWDRLGRDAADFLSVVRDREVHSISEQGEPPLLRDLRAVLAQEERRKIRERTQAAATQLFFEGRYNGPRPLGYEFVDGQLEPRADELAIRDRIFAEFLDGRGISAITRGLNADRVPTVRGGAWRTATVRSVLMNPVYVGKVRFKGETRDGNHAATMDAETWDRAQILIGAQRSAPGRGRGRKPVAGHLFIRGLLRCGECGEAMVPRSNSGYPDYICGGRQMRGCQMPIVQRKRIDQAVYRYFEQVGLDVEATHAAIAEGHDRKLAEIRALTAAADTEAHRAAERLRRVRRDYQDGKLDAEDYREQRAELRVELDGAGAELERLRASEAEIERDTSHVDIERTALAHLAEIRRAIAGEVQSAAGIDSVRAALTRLFEHFVLHRCMPERVHVELIGEPWIEPIIRTEAIEGTETVHPSLHKQPIGAAGPNNAGAWATADSLFAPIPLGSAA